MLAVNERVTHEAHRVPREALELQRPSRREAAPAVRPRPHVSLSDRISLFVCILICASVLWVLAVKGAQIQAANDAIAKLQTEIQKVNADNASLTARVDTLTRPTRILDIALHRLHMQYGTPIQIAANGR